MWSFACADELRQGNAPKVSRKSRRIAAAQGEKTIWLYELWWEAPSLRNTSGLHPEKGHGPGIVDALLNAFMQTKEGGLLHEVSTLSRLSFCH